MTITLSPDQECIIQAHIASGQFDSADEVFTGALTALESRPPNSISEDREGAAQAAVERIAELRKGVALDLPAGMSLRDYAHNGRNS